MDTLVEEYVNQLNAEEQRYFHSFREMIYEVFPNAEERLFAKQPYYSLPTKEKITFHERKAIIMNFFKDHMNVFALGNEVYQNQLKYKFTKKHTMQIYFTEKLDIIVLKQLIKDSL